MYKLIGSILGVGFFILVITIISALLINCVFYFLWNITMPVIFGMPKLGFIQSWALIVVANLLFNNGTVQAAIVLLQTSQQDEPKDLLKD